jgi:hypothetical protein
MPNLFGPSLASALGITDRATGIERAEAARLKMIDRAFQAFGQQTNLNVPKMTLLSMMTRAQAFHDGAIEAAKSDNPFATFTLLRSYAENAAMLIWISTKQGELRRLYPDAPVELKFSIGKLVAHAERDSAGFREIYEQLSRFAHPGSSTAFSGFRVTGQKPLAIFSSRPSFKNDDDFMLACVWLIELAEANGALWVKSWGRYFGATALWDPPDWDPTEFAPSELPVRSSD